MKWIIDRHDLEEGRSGYQIGMIWTKDVADTR